MEHVKSVHQDNTLQSMVLEHAKIVIVDMKQMLLELHVKSVMLVPTPMVVNVNNVLKTHSLQRTVPVIVEHAPLVTKQMQHIQHVLHARQDNTQLELQNVRVVHPVK